MRYWHERDITERLIAARLERKCLQLCNSGIMGTHNADLLTATDRDDWHEWEA